MEATTRTLMVDAPGARLAVDVDGPDPVRILLCHGGPGGPDDFAELRDRLGELGVSCARFDQRGVHRSKILDGRWDLEAYVSDVEAIREALGVERLVVFGHSWGGVVARAWAKAHPERVLGVLLASPSAAVGSDWPAMEAQVMRYLRDRVSFLGYLVVGLWSLVAMIPGPIGDRGMSEVYGRVLRAYTGEAKVPEWVHHSSARAAHGSRVALRKLPSDVLDGLGLPDGVPARAVFGDDDIYGSLTKVFAAQHPDIETTFLERCGHILWHDAPDAWDTWLLEGLRLSGVFSGARGRHQGDDLSPSSSPHG
jgi:proline iminopeptidase